MIQIKNAKELDGMRKANALSAAALKYGGEPTSRVCMDFRAQPASV